MVKLTLYCIVFMLMISPPRIGGMMIGIDAIVFGGWLPVIDSRSATQMAGQSAAAQKPGALAGLRGLF